MTRLLIILRCLVLSAASLAFGGSLAILFAFQTHDAALCGCLASAFAAMVGVAISVGEAVEAWKEEAMYRVTFDPRDAQSSVVSLKDESEGKTRA